MNHPEYPSGQGFWSTAVLDGVAAFFGTNKVTWTIPTSKAGVTRRVQKIDSRPGKTTGGWRVVACVTNEAQTLAMTLARGLGFGTSLVLHVGAIVAMVWKLPPSAPASASAAASPPMGIAVPRRVDVPETGIAISAGRAPSPLQIGGFSFDYQKIADRPGDIFPFLTRVLPLERTTVTARYQHTGGLMNPPAAAAVRRSTFPLALSDEALQQLVDTAWSRRERWRPFRRIAALVTGHGPDDERVATLLRAYRDQNVLQPYIDTSRDAALWVMLGIAADHTDFMEFVIGYASRHPSSIVTTELLFLLDELAQGSFDTLSLLLDTRGHELWWTRDASRDAYDLFVTLQQYYRVQLTRAGVSREQLGTYYDGVRLRILSHIVATTPDGYRINDARFLSGAIYWNQGRRAEALNVWRQMTSDPAAAYATASSELTAAVFGTSGRDGSDVDAAAVNRILDAEKSRWLVSSGVRLAQFGYDVDTF